MALTAGQQKALDNLNHIKSTTWQDWVPTSPSGTDQYGISTPAWFDQNVQDLYNAPEGTVSASQFQYAMDAANQVAQTGDRQALGQRYYDQQLADANESVKWWDENPNGHKQSFMDTFMYKILPVVAITMMGGAAMMGTGGAAGAGAAGAVEGGAAGAAAGGASTGAAAGAAGAGAAGAGMAAGGTAAAGSAAAASAIPQVFITGSLASAGGAGVGAGTLAAGAAGLGGLAAMSGGGSAAGPSTSTTSGQQAEPAPINSGLGENPQMPIDHAALEQMPTGVASGGSSMSNYLSTAKDLKSIYDGVMPYISGNVDRINARQDADFWKGQLDTLGGMYKPGTPEAELMRQKMEAQDAASGRRSQYGIRSVNLASALADKRAGIMTSAGYQNMANAYRNRSSNDLNGLFAAAGNGSGSNNSGWIDALGRLGSAYFGGST